MTKDKVKIIHLVYSIVLSVLCVVAGICLIVGCVSIYNSGDRPFSPEAIGEAFAKIAVPVYICLIFILGAFFLNLFLPNEEKKKASKPDERTTLQNLYKKISLEYCPSQYQAQIKTQRTFRFVLSIAVFFNFAINIAMALVHIFDSETFAGHSAMIDVRNAVLVLLRYAVVAFVLGLVLTYFNKYTLRKEIDLVKKSIAKNIQRGDPVDVISEQEAEEGKFVSFFKNHKKAILIIARCLLIALSVTFIVVGIVTGGMEDVLQKAINICTECIGLG
ncbi:MAG: hypothetical protein J6K52_00330 [Clostridia bacterium]|nr:hypothetical protein [Clostridia bacterium]MBO5092048.1 hypothetical protein [Clostridia bacterium]MBP3494636.1 hypothetical protein [Clostridia bacterium]